MSSAISLRMSSNLTRADRDARNARARRRRALRNPPPPPAPTPHTLIDWRPLQDISDQRVIDATLDVAFPKPVIWEPQDREPLEPHQVPPTPPAGNWRLWLLEGGRGSGKTEAGSRYFCKYMQEHAGHRGRIIAPTLGDAIESCVTGPSGILSVDPTARFLPSAPGGAKVIWPNGSEAVLYGTHVKKDTERLRAGGNKHLDWWEEAGANRMLKEAWDNAKFGLRLGDWPHAIATSTPRALPAYRALRKLKNTVMTHGTINDNPHLDPEWKAEMIELYRGTRVGRQELDGELLNDVPGALWTWAMIETAYSTCPQVLPEFKKVVVAIDPAAKSKRESDDTGIIVAARGADDHAYILADYSCHTSPEKWAAKAIYAFDEHEANKVAVETNNGGDMVESVLRTLRSNLPIEQVTATRGKKIRAEPISTLYEQQRVHHAVKLPALDSQLTEWDPEGDESPDRLDALVWALTQLGFAKQIRKWSML